MITLNLTPELERHLTAYAKYKQQPVEDVLNDLVPKLPEEKAVSPIDEDEDDWNAAPLYETLSEEEFEKYMDELAEMGRGWGSLPNSAFDRETLYEKRI